MKLKIISQLKSFFRRWNGAAFFPIVLLAFFGLNYLTSQVTGDEYPLIGVVAIFLAVAKAFLAEGLASLMLFFNQPEYFKVVNDQDEPKLELKYKKKTWRDSAYNYYALYFLGACLILGFA